MYKFYLTIKGVKKEISQPIGFDTSVFTLKVDSGRFGLDTSFSETRYTFSSLQDHLFYEILEDVEQHGFESVIILDIETEIDLALTFQLDIKNSSTDGIKTFSATGIQKSAQGLIQKRSGLKVNLFDTKTIDGMPIVPCSRHKVVIDALPTINTTEWGQTPLKADVRLIKYKGLNSFSLVNLFNSMGTQEISNTYLPVTQVHTPIRVPFSGTGRLKEFFNQSAMYTSEGITNGFSLKVKDVNLKISNALPTTKTSIVYIILKDDEVDNDTRSYYAIKNSLSPAITLFTKTGNFDVKSGDLEVNIPSMNNLQNLYIYVVVTDYRDDEEYDYTPNLEISGGSMVMTQQDESITTTAEGVLLRDALEYVIKSTTGVNNKMFTTIFNSIYSDQIILNGNALRGINNSFYLSLDTLFAGIKEIGADFMLNKPNGSDIFIGVRKDFYLDTEAWIFEKEQFDGMTFAPSNEQFSINKFQFKYELYQSEKELVMDNTQYIVHGSQEFSLTNKGVENTKTIVIPWARDPYVLAKQQKTALTENSTVSTQDDNKVFIIDNELTDTSKLIFNNMNLTHTINDGSLILSRKEAGFFNFKIMGLNVSDTLYITAGANQGQYLIENISNKDVTLKPINIVPTYEGEAFTAFNIAVNVMYTPYPNSLFSTIKNVPEYIGNLRFTVKRNILNYWNDYLSTANIYTDKNILASEIINNKKCETSLGTGSLVIEGADIKTNKKPILTPVVYKDVKFICDLNTFLGLRDALFDTMGYISFKDFDGVIRKGYPSKLSYSVEKQLVTCDLLEKYSDNSIQIVTIAKNTYQINGTTLISVFVHSWVNNKLRIFANNGLMVAKPAFWNEVTINGASPKSLQELKDWLKLL